MPKALPAEPARRALRANFLTATVRVDIFVERVQDGEVVLVAAEPRLEAKRG